jgi:hypothetical protein
MRLLVTLSVLTSAALPARADHKPLPRFERVVIDDDLPGGYQVEVADVDGDNKPDVVALGNGTVAWYQNPTWTKRIITGPDTTPGVISTATRDLDGDGKAEVAIAYDFEMNEPRRGKLGLAVPGKSPDDAWRFRRISDESNTYASIHRLRWGNVLFGDDPVLVVAPIFNARATPPDFEGPARPFLVIPDSRRIADFEQGEGQFSTMFPAVADCRPVLHAIEVRDVDGDGRDEILTAHNSGVSLIRVSKHQSDIGWHFTTLAEGAPGEAPNRGCSEVHLGRFGDGRRFLAAIEPWHGSMVVVYPGQGPDALDLGPRTVIDDTLDAGHALWTADVDGDGDDEIFAGHRGKDHRVSAYDFDGQTWHRTVLDRDIAAQDLRGGDLDGDGTPDVVAVGGSTHNVAWYRPIRR